MAAEDYFYDFPDDEWDEEDRGEFPFQRIPKGSWKTKEGKIIKLKDMTATHLANAIAYCEKKSRPELVSLLLEEKKRRVDEAFFSKVEVCRYCSGKMIRVKLEPDIEVGMPPPPQYCFSCQKCGACGPKHSR